MKLSLEKKGLRWLAAVALGALAMAAQFYAGRQLGAGLKSNLLFSGALGAAAGAAAVVRVELKSWWSVLIQQVCTAFAALFLLHFVLVSGINLPVKAFVNNMAISLAVVLLGTAVTGCPRLVSAVWLAFCWAFGMVDCAVMQFRGNIIALSDVYSIGTALSVAGNYTFEFMPRMYTALVVFVIAVLVVLRSRVKRRTLRWPVRAAAAVLAVVSMCIPVSRMDAITARNWGRDAAYYNGILMEFLVEAEHLFVKAPEGYSTEGAEAMLKECEEAAAAQEDPPHVIAIMVEALSDLSAVGEFETSAPVMPFTSGFVENTIHGYALSPVYGGGTCSSEWEFLTGNSMAFVPNHANVYRQFVRGEVNSIVKLFGNMGYRCIAMHPYHATGWDRQRVYPLLGFEETVRAVGLKKDYPDVNQYLSLLQLTDKAIEELITYFESSDEKVQIVLFGDHQPRIDAGFYSEIGMDSAQDQYSVPYFLWKNYEEDAAELPLTGINYLPVMMLQSMGVEMPAYYEFLEEIRETVPAVNHVGCMVDGGNIPLDSAKGEILEAFKKYEALQYANMFDENVDETLFIGRKE